MNCVVLNFKNFGLAYLDHSLKLKLLVMCVSVHVLYVLLAESALLPVMRSSISMRMASANHVVLCVIVVALWTSVMHACLVLYLFPVLTRVLVARVWGMMVSRASPAMHIV